jgi:CheY-like chemotaxis protein
MKRPAILLVDDDEQLRSALARGLGHYGYEVTVAEDGVAALELLRAGHAFDVVVSDYDMPRMNGAALLAELEREAPELAERTIIVTGTDEHARGVLPPGARVLGKPIGIRELASEIERVLAAARDHGRSE